MNFAHSNDYISEVKLKYPMLKEPKKEHAFLSPSDFNLFIKHITYDLAYKRVLFARNTGLRPSELTYLAWSDLDLELGILKIQSKTEWKPKTNEERIVYLNNTAIEILRELNDNKRGRWVFSETDRPVKSIRKALATASRNAGLNKKVTPNMMRHTFATHALLRGGDIMSIKDQMGHSDIKTTEKYLHSVDAYRRKTVDLPR
ncbi:Integrase, catalytic core, phage domain protein [Candidatus Magnetoovum chiemensis]|nr:Integrase, catalytic core, phage domain protein [Candidatus Magnetoovum chiemensis]